MGEVGVALGRRLVKPTDAPFLFATLHQWSDNMSLQAARRSASAAAAGHGQLRPGSAVPRDGHRLLLHSERSSPMRATAMRTWWAHSCSKYARYPNIRVTSTRLELPRYCTTHLACFC